jgi:dolichol-phosphate mannosyltransferase
MTRAFTADVSVIVPTLDEMQNIAPLLRRIDASMRRQNISYEVIVIDDHSQDGTLREVARLQHTFPVDAYLKQGKRGKAYSLMEGFKKTNAPLVAMIDGDLQYPPEALPAMIHMLRRTDADIVLTHRIEHFTSLARQLTSRLFNMLFIRMLFGIRYDVQSGLKVFKHTALRGLRLAPRPWSFDLEFIVRNLERNRRVLTFPIPFLKRQHGETKVRVVKTAVELAKTSLALRRKISFRRIANQYKNNAHFQSYYQPSPPEVLWYTELEEEQSKDQPGPQYYPTYESGKWK